jgi:hypothetical protein
MNRIKLIALIISMLSIFCSCSNTNKVSDEKSTPTKRVRAMWVARTNSNLFPLVDSTVVIISVDTFHRVGDIIARGNIHWKIID